MFLPRQPKLQPERKRTAGGPVEADAAIAELFGWENAKAMQEHLRQVRRRFERMRVEAALEKQRAGLPPEPPAPSYIESYSANDPEHGYELPTKHGGPAGPGNPHYFPSEAAAWLWYDRVVWAFRVRLTNDGRSYTMKPYTRRERPGL